MSEYKKYQYTGPIYYHGNKIAEYSNFFTMAKSYKHARKNFLYKAANGDYMSRYDIVGDYITLVEDDTVDEPIEFNDVHYCDICGCQLNDIGECPECVYGDSF